MATTLAFRTTPGAVSIPVGQSKTLGAVDVHSFERIRVVADERVGSAGPVVIRLTITEGERAGLAARHADASAALATDARLRGTRQQADDLRRRHRRVGLIVRRRAGLRRHLRLDFPKRLSLPFAESAKGRCPRERAEGS